MDITLFKQQVEAFRAIIGQLPESLQMFFVMFLDSAQSFCTVYTPDCDQLQRRHFVREALAFLDGVTHLFKGYALAQQAQKPGTYLENELAFLRNEARDPTDTSVRPGHTKVIPADINFRYAVDLMMRRWSPGFLLDNSGEHWQTFKRSQKVRKRITHPKQLREFTITDEELFEARATLEWVLLVVCTCAIEFVKAVEIEFGVLGQISGHSLFGQFCEQITPYGRVTKETAPSNP